MNDQTDSELLRIYAEDRVEPAFAELVRRHVDFVYSAAVRLVRDPHLAEDVTQAVFIALGKSAPHLLDRATLSGWLHKTAKNIAAQTVRTIERRRTREEEAAIMNQLLSPQTEADWEQLAPQLDAALDELSETDREAVLLRYFRNHDFRTVGAMLGINDDTAQKRVSRAVEQMREFFANRGVTVGASGMVVLISAHAVQAAPAGLAATISAAAVFTGTAVSASTIITATKTIAMTTLQKIVITAALVTAVSAGFFEAQQVAIARAEMRALQQQQAEQIQQQQKERDAATNRLNSLIKEMANLKNNNSELLKLRGEVSRLREKNDALSKLSTDEREVLLKSWFAREDRLKQIVEQYADKKIPDLQLLSEQDWLNAAKDANFDTDKDIQRTLANLRNAAGYKFAQIAADAVKQYMAANHDQFPTDLAQLQPYFNTPISGAILSRWEIMPQAAFPNQKMGGDWVIAVNDPVDRELDSSIVIGPGSYGSSDYHSVDTQRAITILEPALKAYAADHNGAQAGIPAEIQPYLTTPEQQAAFQTLMQKKLINNKN